MSQYRSWAKQHFVGLALLVALLFAAQYAVRIWKSNHKGAMSVTEAQAMDMTAMKPTVGAVPVANWVSLAA